MNCGGPAFPVTPGLGVLEGLTKREWFAGMALTGIVESGVYENYSPEHIAQTCCKLADAMLTELEKEKC